MPASPLEPLATGAANSPWLFFGVLFVILFLFGWFQPRAMNSLARWSYVLEPPKDGQGTGNGSGTMPQTAQSLYARLYEAYAHAFESQPLPLHKVGFGPRTLLATHTVFGGRPVYLQLRYTHLSYFISIVPSSQGLHISAWLFSRYTGWEDNPWTRLLLWWKLSGQTLYAFDVTEAFHEVAHRTLVGVIEECRAAQGLPPLPLHETRPVLRSFYAALKQPPLPQFTDATGSANPHINAHGAPLPNTSSANGHASGSLHLPAEALRPAQSGNVQSANHLENVPASQRATTPKEGRS